MLIAVVLSHGAPVPWNAVGPDGGDARSIAAVPGDPSHLYLGTTNSWIYESTDSAASWHRLAKLESDDNLVVDHLVIDQANSSVLYAAAWTLSHPGGGLWVSRDGGRSWSESPGLHGQSIRAFVQAASTPATLIAGTLEGVFRSKDSGATWIQISPKDSHEIHEVESLAVDPTNPDIVYAGTWHLPWKTSDGGESWHSIKKGVIDDSDVFSIIIDPEKPQTIYASACSGIYKSETGGELFRKIQGIPATARRTRVLRQDPSNRKVVYAGTTEGLYKTTDGGRTFKRMTGPEVIVNDVSIDPANPQHVLLATDRGGVLASVDAGTTFTQSNAGFSERKVEALLVDRQHAERIFAGVVNDKTFGSVFVSIDNGVRWKQIASGLDGRDVFGLAQSPEGTILAGTNSGIFTLDQDSSGWLPGGHDRQDGYEEHRASGARNAGQHRKTGEGSVARDGRAGFFTGSFWRCLACFDQRRHFYQQGRRRDLAGRTGHGRGRVPFRCRAWSPNGRGNAECGRALTRCRPELVAHRHPRRSHAHSVRCFLAGRNAMDWGSGRSLLLA